MTKRRTPFGIAIILCALFCTPALASEARETPLVRAVKRARACVVNIHSEKTTYGDEALFATGNKSRKVNGMGTGIVIDPRGYIVTNHHVVNGVESLRCTLHDGSTYIAQVISYDRKQDLAIIKIGATRQLPVMPLGTSSDLMLGETVIAMGNAFGYEHTITSGIISALARDVEVNEEQAYHNLIQTDASINPGNSGGPLLNLDGEVVGINVAIRAGAQRIGFAIPIDDARQIIAKLLSIEQLNQTQHGLLGRDIKSTEKRELIVESTKPGSPAELAGLKPGDLIVKAGEVEVTDGADFERALLGRGSGERVDVLVRRGAETTTATITLREFAGYTPAMPASSTTVVRAKDNASNDVVDRAWRVLGVRLERLSNPERFMVNTQYSGGMQVVGVRAGGPAALSGIRKDDILVGLHVWETVKQEDVAYVLDSSELKTGKRLKFYILRGRETLYGHLDTSTITK